MSRVRSVLRDYRGKVLIVGATRIQDGTINIGEELSLLFGFTLACKVGGKNLVIEGDSMNIISAFKNLKH